MKHRWGYYCEDRDFSRVLVIETNKSYNDPELENYLKSKFTEFLCQYETSYTCSDNFYYLAINIYNGDK